MKFFYFHCNFQPH